MRDAARGLIVAGAVMALQPRTGVRAEPLDLVVQVRDAVHGTPFEAPGADDYYADILPGQATVFSVLLGPRLYDAGAPPAAREWLREHASLLVLKEDADFDSGHGTELPFEIVERRACQLAVAALEYDSTPDPCRAGSVSYVLPEGHALEPGGYFVVALLDPRGLETVLAPDFAEIAGLVDDYVPFRVLDPDDDANRNFIAQGAAWRAACEGRFDEALAIAQTIVDRCPDSAVATAFRASFLDHGSSAEYARALHLLERGDACCDRELLASSESIDFRRSEWSWLASLGW